MIKKSLLVICCAFYTTFIVAQIPSNPVREYLFTGSSLSNTASTGSGGDLSVTTGNGYMFVEDRSGNLNAALSVQGTQFFAGIIPASTSEPKNSLGISFWYKFEQNLTGGSFENIFDLLEGASNNRFLVRRIGDDSIEFRLTVGGGTSAAVIQESVLTSTTEYTHIYFNIISDVGQKTVDAYVNGVLNNWSTLPVNSNIFSSNISSVVGRIDSGTGLNATLDDIRFYDRNLNDTEIQQLASEGVNTCSDVVNIPDANFKAALLDHGVGITGADISVIDTDGDGEICSTEAAAYTGKIAVNSQAIVDLTGIEAFTNITTLDCDSNQLSSINVSQNTLLTELRCSVNVLSSLDVSSNTALTTLICGANSLSSIDVSNNLALDQLVCSFNSLTDLDVSANTVLTSLTCNNNQLTNLNVANGNNNNVAFMDARFNSNLSCIQHDTGFDPITNINWRKDTGTNWSDDCSSSSCTSFVNIPDANFKATLIANSAINTDGDNEICSTEAAAFAGVIVVSSSNIADLTGIEAFTNIIGLNCSSNLLTSIDISSNTALTSFNCRNNQLTALNVSVNTALQSLTCGSNQLSSLDVSNNTVLTNLNCSVNQINDLDVSNNIALLNLDCTSNLIGSLDISANVVLTDLFCGNNQLTSLNVANGNNPNFTAMNATVNANLDCIQHDSGFDPTTNSNWSKDTSTIWSDNCSASTCTSFVNIPDPNFKAYLVGNTAINTDGDNEICTTEAQAFTGVINTNNNSSITDLTGIEAFINLTELRLFNNSLTSLDVSNNTALTVLACGRNSLTSLDVSNNTALTELICSFNMLTALDVSSNTSLVQLFCQDNTLTNLNVANGNNSNMTFMNAPNNPSLSCIQHDTGFDPTSATNWVKDTSTVWSDDCNSLSTDAITFSNSVTMFPNPTSSELHVKSDIYEIKSIEIFDISGKRVMSKFQTQSVDTKGLVKGIYMVKVKSMNNRMTIKKLVKL